MGLFDGFVTGVRNIFGFKFDNSTTQATAEAHLLDREAVSEIVNAESTHEAVEQAGQAGNTLADGASAGMTLTGMGSLAGGAGGLVEGGGHLVQGVLRGVGDLEVQQAQAGNIRAQGDLKAAAARIDCQVAGEEANHKLVQTELDNNRTHFNFVNQRISEGLDLAEEEIEKTMLGYPDAMLARLVIIIAASGDRVRQRAKGQLAIRHQMWLNKWPGAYIDIVPTPVRSDQLGDVLNARDREYEDKLSHAWRIARGMGGSSIIVQKEIIRWMDAQGPPSWRNLDAAQKRTKAHQLYDIAGRNRFRGDRTIVVLVSESIGSDKAVFSLTSPGQNLNFLSSSLLSDCPPQEIRRGQWTLEPSLRIVAAEPGGQPSVIIRGKPPKSGFIMHTVGDITNSGDNTWWPPTGWIYMGMQEDLEAYQARNSWSRQQALRVRLAHCFVGGVAFQTKPGQPLYWPVGDEVDRPSRSAGAP